MNCHYFGNGFILATTMTPASESDSVYLPYLTIASCHTKDPIEKVYADKGYYGEPNSGFLRLNEINYDHKIQLDQAALRRASRLI